MLEDKNQHKEQAKQSQSDAKEEKQDKQEPKENLATQESDNESDEKTGKDLKEEVKILKQFLDEWKDVPEDKITFKRLNGLSNAVYKVTTDEDVSPKTLILRKFGDTSTVVDNNKEDKVFQKMSDTGKGPKCYGSTDDYRLEEFFESKKLKIHDVNKPEWRRKLAVAMASHHQLELEGLKKENLLVKRLKDDKFWKAFDKKCEEGDFTSEEKPKIEELRKLHSEEEFEFIRSVIPEGNIVFSHNDTLCNNVLISEEDNKTVLIDYEYADYNNRAFDAADLFVESMMDYDEDDFPYYKLHPSKFPAKADIEDFARYYLYATTMKTDIEKLETDEKKIKNDAWLIEEIEGNKDFQEDLKLFLEEFQKNCILSQFFWITWGVVMCKPEDPQSAKFDYLAYAYDKLDFYQKWKEDFKNNKLIFE